MKIYLAPMEGLLDHFLRKILTEMGGYDLCVSEFIRINQHLLSDSSILQVVPELKNKSRTSSGIPVKVQILGSDPVCMAENADKIAKLGAYGIDLNFGCPAPTVNRNRGGAILLKEPDLLFQIVQSVRKAVPKEIPVTSKMRLGYESKDLAIESALALEAGGLEEVVVHARTKVDGYKPPAYWEWIAKIKAHLRIPVIANGEIWDVESANRCKIVSGCENIMIGRGAISNPNLANQIRANDSKRLDWNQVVSLLQNFVEDMESNSKHVHSSGRVKQWLKYLAREYPEAKHGFELSKKITKSFQILENLKGMNLSELVG
ncbi:MAG: tRNA-dihydrouridine synthase [Leptospira sp.]|nr:tRNA-dihydrouridine synthase [Leptospira sp.]